MNWTLIVCCLIAAITVMFSVSRVVDIWAPAPPKRRVDLPHYPRGDTS